MTKDERKRLTPEREARIRERAAESEHHYDGDLSTLFDEIEVLRMELAARDERIRELERQVTNLTSTVEAWNHAEIIKCGCKYNKVWGGMKWEHWLSPCKEHRELEQQLKAAQERLAEAEQVIHAVQDEEIEAEHLVEEYWKEYFAKHPSAGKEQG